MDTETTGLDEQSEIVEISLIDSDGTVLLDTLVKPLERIPAGATEVPVLVVDVTDKEADLILATYDPIGDLAQRNIDHRRGIAIQPEIVNVADHGDNLARRLLKLGTVSLAEDEPIL